MIWNRLIPPTLLFFNEFLPILGYLQLHINLNVILSILENTFYNTVLYWKYNNFHFFLSNIILGICYTFFHALARFSKDNEK
jgi:hypothetical protein